MSGQVGEAFKFQISGFIGTTLFYFAYEYLFSLLAGVNYGGLIAWVVSYAASIWWQFEVFKRLIYLPCSCIDLSYLISRVRIGKH